VCSTTPSNHLPKNFLLFPGNGTQDLTYDDPNIFYLSIHRASFDDSKDTKEVWFYPGTGRPTEVGEGAGAGTNLNIVWPRGGMGNGDYSAAFAEHVLPALARFQPDLIIIACGLDAAKGDKLGDCGLSPDMYYIMTKSLLDQAGADMPFVIVLEGGYNINVSARCMQKIALALLDEPCRDGKYYDLSRYLNGKKAEKVDSNTKIKKKRSETSAMGIQESEEALDPTVASRAPAPPPCDCRHDDVSPAGLIKKRKQFEEVHGPSRPCVA
jgi:acetoin utilization deacetylase AcuC-like enzyme